MKILTDPLVLAEEFVSILSVNPELAESSGEKALAARVAEFLESIGAVVDTQEVQGTDRHNVLGTLDGDLDTVIVLEAHLDTVPLPTAALPVGVQGGRLWGRGSCDTKASMASMLVAMESMTHLGAPRPTVIFAAVVDEEYVMKGARVLADRISSADAVIIGEPTNLNVVRAHNGCVRFDVIIRGRTAHSSRASLGRNAIVDASRITLALHDRLGLVLEGSPHPLTGAGLLTATSIEGGIAPNVVPDLCTVRFDRRLVPGETIDEALAAVDRILLEVREESGVDAVRLEPWLDLPAMEMSEDHPLVKSAVHACRTSVPSGAPQALGVPYCTDANILTGYAHIPSVVVGPGSIDQAHSPEEWVAVPEVRSAVNMYRDLVIELGRNTDVKRVGNHDVK